jgi:diacylglycerol kinase family enzyme
VATVGLSTQIALGLTDPMKRQWGRFVYAFALTRALRTVEPFRVRIETENGLVEMETMQVVLGNGRFHAGPFPLSPNASITEGKLTLYELGARHRIAFLKLALSLPYGRHVDLEDVHWQDTEGGTITTYPPLAVTIDGEVCEQSPIPFSVAPDVLRVRVPKEFRG